MLRRLLTALGLLFISCWAAHAMSVTVSTTAPTGYANYDLSADVGGQHFSIPDGGTFSGWGYVYAAGDNVDGLQVGSYTEPFMAVNPSINAAGQVLQFSTPQTALYMEVYTPDDYNVFALGSAVFYGDATTQGIYGGAGSHNLSFDSYNHNTVWLAFTDMDPFTVAQFTSFSPSNEFNIGHIESAAAPEASTWAMMLLGFAGLGYAAHRKTRHAAIA